MLKKLREGAIGWGGNDAENDLEMNGSDPEGSSHGLNLQIDF